LAKAFDLNPSFPMAGLLLVDQYLNAGELEQAGETLAVLEREVGGPYVEARRVRLLAAQGNRQEACAATSALCGVDSTDSWPVQTALGALEGAGWQDDARGLLYTAAEQEVFHPEVAT